MYWWPPVVGFTATSLPSLIELIVGVTFAMADWFVAVKTVDKIHSVA